MDCPTGSCPAEGSTYEPGGSTLGTTLGAPDDAGMTGTLNWVPGTKEGALADKPIEGDGDDHPGPVGAAWTGVVGAKGKLGTGANPGGAVGGLNSSAPQLAYPSPIESPSED